MKWWLVVFTLNLLCVLLGLSLLFESWPQDRMQILIVTLLIVTPAANLLS